MFVMLAYAAGSGGCYSAYPAPDPVKLPANGRFILPTTASDAMFKQCSRPAPQHVDGYWEPDAKDIDKMETDLTAYIATHVTLYSVHPIYNRQYVGFTQNGERLIYGNFYPPVTDASASKQNEIPVIICDGGRSFWGIIYHPKTHRFELPQFNGSV